jgi:hypothetical protein
MPEEKIEKLFSQKKNEILQFKIVLVNQVICIFSLFTFFE